MRVNACEVQQMRTTMKTSEIAEYYGITMSALYSYCYRHNLILLRITDWELAEEIGTKTVKEIAAEYNVSSKTIYSRLAKLGICPKQEGQRR